MKKIKSQKGFTLVEILAVIAILGILTGIAIGGIQLLLDKAKEEFYNEQENNMIMAAQAYYQTNRNKLPKKIGKIITVSLKELEDAKYIDPIKDRNKNNCDNENSYVKVFKYSQTDYRYTVKLVCPGEYDTYLENSNINPTVKITAPDGDKLNDVKKVNAIIDLYGESKDKKTKLISYNYIIYSKLPETNKYVEVKNTGSIKINGTSKKVNVPLDEYLPSTIRIQVTAINEKGGITTELSDPYDYADRVDPRCEKGAGESTIWSTASSRRITVKCLDPENGSGCARPHFTKVFTEEAQVAYLPIKDQAGRVYNCPVDVYLDRTKPTLKINVRNKNATGKVLKTITVDDITPTQSLNTGWINKATAPDGIYIEYIAEDTVGLKKIEYKKNESGLTSNSPKLNTYGKVNTIDLEKKQEDKENEIDTAKSLSGKLLKITEDGYNKITTTLTDLSGKTVTVNLTVPYDKTEPTITYTNTSKGNWTKIDITIKGTGSDEMSGILKTEYSYDKKTWKNDWDTTNKTTNVSKTWKEDINKSLYIKTTDIAGNTKIAEKTSVKKDTVPPKIIFDPNKKKEDGGNKEDWYKTSDDNPLIITIDCEDPASGKDKLKIDGKEESFSKKITIKKAKNYVSYTVTCIDKLGNSDTKTQKYYTKVKSRSTSCDCEVANTCSAAGCASYGTKTKISYDLIDSTKTTTAYPTGTTKCSEETHDGDYNVKNITCISCVKGQPNANGICPASNNRCDEWRYTKQVCKVTKTKVTDYSNCLRHVASEAICGCNTRKNCWHY